MQESPEDISDESLARLWTRFGNEYSDLGYRRKSFELFAHYLARELPHGKLAADEIERRVRVYKKRLRDQKNRKQSERTE